MTKFDSKLAKLLDDMYETMIEYDGVGLAAPQIGLGTSKLPLLMLMMIMGTIEMINPRFLKLPASKQDQRAV